MLLDFNILYIMFGDTHFFLLKVHSVTLHKACSIHIAITSETERINYQLPVISISRGGENSFAKSPVRIATMDGFLSRSFSELLFYNKTCIL